MAVDAYYFDNTLLLSFDGMEGATVFEDRSPFKHPIQRFGDAKITNAYSKFGGGSVACDGNGDYLRIDNQVINLATGDFTVEGWTRTTSTADQAVISINAGISGSANAQMYVIWTGGNLRASAYSGGAIAVTFGSVSPINDGEFHHFAFVRQGTSYYFFVDGLVVGSATSTAPLNYAATFKTFIGAGNPTEYPLLGHVEDLRITRNIARYTKNFTPPSAAFVLGTYAGGAGGDPDIDKVVLLLHGDGTNGSTVIVDSSPVPKTVTANGNVVISTAASKFGGASAYFDGAGDYLTVPNGADFDLGSGDFTIEFWAYPTSATESIVCSKRNNASLSPVQITIGTTANLYTSVSGSAWAVSLAGPPVPLNAWSHIAAIRNGNSFNIYVNGVGATPVAVAGALVTNTFPFSIGATSDGSFPFIGYLDDFRFTKGVVRYTANFTPPTVPHPDTMGGTFVKTDPYADNVSLLLHMDGANNATTFTDSSLTPKTVTPIGGAKLTTTSPKYGSACATFNGTTDALSIADSADLNLSTGDFTVELQAKSTAGVTAIIMARTLDTTTANTDIPANCQYRMHFSADNVLHFQVFIGTSTIEFGTASGFRDGNWHHLAMCREGDVFSAFVDGICIGQRLVAGVVLNNGAGWATRIGDQGVKADAFFNGQIDEVRITKGVARYSAPPLVIAANPLDMLPVQPTPVVPSVLVNTEVFAPSLKLPKQAESTRDVYHAGVGRIAGTVAEASSPTDRPVSRRVRLHRKVDGMLIRETWSKADGTYSFENIENAQDYYVVSFDHNQIYNAAIKDAITPEVPA